MTAAILAHLLDGEAGTFFSRAETSPLDLPDSDLLASFKDMPIVVLVDKVSSGEPERLGRAGSSSRPVVRRSWARRRRGRRT